MHTAFNRLSVVFFFSLGILFLCAFGCGTTHFSSTLPASSALSASIKDVVVKYPKPFRGAYRGMEYVLMEFKLKTDLSSLWNWNTKQLFVSVVAHFATPSHPHNTQILWNRIIDATDVPTGKKKSKLDVDIYWEMSQPLDRMYTMGKELSMLYGMKNDLRAIASNANPQNRSVVLRVHYEVFPIVGMTYLGVVPDEEPASVKIDPLQPVYTRPH